MSALKKCAGLAAGLSAVAVLGVALAQSEPPNPLVPNFAVGAGQQSPRFLTPMGETGVLAPVPETPVATLTKEPEVATITPEPAPAPAPAPVAEAPEPAPAPVAAAPAPEPATSTMGAPPEPAPMRPQRQDRN